METDDHPLFPDPQDPTRHYHQGDLNSNAAFASLKDDGVLHSQREAVFEVILEAGTRGVTADEVEVILVGKHQSVTARVVDLLKANRIYRLPKNQRRKTRAGRWAWVNVVGSDPDGPPGQYEKDPPSAKTGPKPSDVARLLRHWQDLGRNILLGIERERLGGKDIELVQRAIRRELSRPGSDAVESGADDGPQCERGYVLTGGDGVCAPYLAPCPVCNEGADPRSPRNCPNSPRNDAGGTR